MNTCEHYARYVKEVEVIANGEMDSDFNSAEFAMTEVCEGCHRVSMGTLIRIMHQLSLAKEGAGYPDNLTTSYGAKSDEDFAEVCIEKSTE